MVPVKGYARAAFLGVYAYCVYHTVVNYLVDYAVCLGNSMTPLLNEDGDGDVVLVNIAAKRLGRIKQNDVVISRQPNCPDKIIGKRIIGMGGDRIRTGDDEIMRVPRGHVWLEGCHPTSYDSRHFGPVPYALIKGKVFFRVWPKFGPVK